MKTTLAIRLSRIQETYSKAKMTARSEEDRRK